MALTATPLRREFNFGGMILPDPNPGLSAEQVREHYAATYPELSTAKTHTEASTDGTKQTTTFTRAVGTKG